MPKLSYNPAEYSLVAERITEFYGRFPQGRIVTDLVSRERDIIFRAEVFRRIEDPVPSATGWASEREGDGEINLVACLENSETSAIGRALANLGFTASKKRASYEEMQKAERARLRFQQPSASTRTPPSHRVAETRQVTETPEENLAERKSDLMLLMTEAADRGVPEAVLEEIAQRLSVAPTSSDDVTAIERRVRHWVVNGYSVSSPPVNTPPQ